VVPQVAPLERNFAEVFKRCRYFPARNPGAGTLEEARRIAMRKPSGKYDVYNKITCLKGPVITANRGLYWIVRQVCQ